MTLCGQRDVCRNASLVAQSIDGLRWGIPSMGGSRKGGTMCTFKESNGVKVQVTCGDSSCQYRQPEYRKKPPKPKK